MSLESCIESSPAKVIEQQLLTDVAKRDVFNNRMITIYLDLWVLLLIKVILVDFVGDEVRIHSHIVLEVADVANRIVFNNRICELKSYAINTVKV